MTMFTEDTLLQHVGQSSFTRGKTYYRRGSVTDVIFEARIVSGKVQGSARTPYSTFIFVTSSRTIDSECSCPIGYACKHVAALGLAALFNSVKKEVIPLGPATTAAGAKTNPAKSWETTLRAAIAGNQEEDDFQKKATVQLLFRIAEEEVPYWDTYGSRKRKRGKWRLELRPRVVYPWAESASLTDLTWKQIRSPYSLARENIPQTPFLFLRQLVSSLESGAYSPSDTWLTISSHTAEYAWHLLQTMNQFGIEARSGTKGEHEVNISSDAIISTMVLTDTEEGVRVYKKLFLSDQELPTSQVLVVGDPPGFSILLSAAPSEEANNAPLSLHPLRSTEGKASHPSKSWESFNVPRNELKRFEQEYLPDLARLYPIQNNSTRVTIPSTGTPRAVVHIVRSGKKSILVRFSFQYENKIVPFKSTEQYMVTRQRIILRDDKQERVLQETIERIFKPIAAAWADDIPGLPNKHIQEEFSLRGIEAARFVAETVPLLQQEAGIDVKISKHVPRFIEDTSQPVVAFSVEDRAENPEAQAQHDWFDLDIMVRVGEESVPFSMLFTALSAGEPYLLLPSGRYFSLQQPVFDSLRSLIREARNIHDPTKEGVVVSRFQAGFWNELKTLGVVEKQSRRWQQAMDTLLGVNHIAVSSVPESLQADLRTYQKEGFHWLSFLHNNNLGGVLGDDMGLGKTVQAIALMATVREQRKKSLSNQPFLVVTPTSVVENWDSELERFAPHLTRAVLRRGNRKEQLQKLQSVDVVVTSYALLLRDFKHIAPLAFETIFFDEAQFAKNYQSKVYNHTRKLTTSCRIALTGTPMENNLMELWTLFSLVTPGLFGSPEHFKNDFQKPIEKEGDAAKLKQLQNRIRPFFLRRTKEVVAAELPPKTEHVVKVDMHPKHHHFYTLHLQHERQKVLGLLEQGGMQQHRFQILSSLTKMRQLALHAALVDPKEGGRVPSSKLDALEEQISSLINGGHRMLIFSQFTSFLALVKKRFDMLKFPYLYLDGSTTKRDILIKKFQTGSVPIFLISLKAGGFGINLTAADYCIVLDPWWNPAVETQAVDRAHRIGQTKHVFVYKFITKNTIEEKVLALQKKKRLLFRSVIDDEAKFSAMITEEDIRNLFA